VGLPAVSSVYVTTKYLISMEPAPGLEPGTCRLRRNRSREARHGLRVYAGTGEGYEFMGFPGVSLCRSKIPSACPASTSLSTLTT